ncbi:hypothetical protein E4O03_05835 [Treponema sp. OMZ 792]|uniref:InlB B-repeat-containing protein n=1 Tax=unclassified Treponema TaxID=2638727 RepID=UPI0020A23E45|nr:MULTISPECIES: hypothetical protein [unclassified Treponema]UTC76218.1 hypothetical protein E4O03_05835 [Treponema sp. OMZ 792]UTC80219.1 hypothetical protein E4O07_05860 [Treponema sp. OMZ 798]
MRKFKAFLIVITVLLLLSACDHFFSDIERDLEYWSSTVLITGNEIPAAGTDNEGYPCLPSAGDKTIILKLTNPQKYILKIPGAQGSPSDIVVFESGVKGADGMNAPRAEIDYYFRQTSSDRIELIYKKAFLKYSEWGSQNLSPTITLYNKEGRKFEQKYTFKLRANTPPLALEYKALCKTQGADGKSYYVLCFEVKDMDKKAGSGSTELLHKDIASITLTPQGGTAQTLPLTVDGSGFNIGNSGILLPAASVKKLEAGDVNQGVTIDDTPTENWIIYLKTDVEVRGPSKEYTLKLTDEKGLTSPEIKKSTATNKLPPVELYHNNTQIMQDSENSPHQINTDMAITLQARAKEGASITGTIKKKVSGSNNWNGAGSVLGTTPADFTLPALENNESGAIYKITLNASAAGYAESESKTFFVKLVKQFSALTPQTLTIHGQNAFGGSVTLPYTTATVQKSDIVLKFNEHTNIPFTIEPSAGLNLTAGVPQNLTINVAASPENYPAWSKTVSVTRAQNDVANLASFKLNGELKTAPFTSEYTVASTTARVTDFMFDANSTGATASVSPGGNANIPANGGTQFIITVKAQNGTQSMITFTVKRKTYPVTFSVQGGQGGSLKGMYNGSHQTASGSNSPSFNVSHGESVTFIAKPEKGWDIESWTGVTASSPNTATLTVDGDKTVTVKFKPGEFNLAGGGSDAWKQLKEEAAKPYGAHTIVIKGEIKATGGENKGEIKLGRDLTIKGKNSAVLDANNQSRIFKVESGKTLTLENITLKNGNAGGGNGGGVYVNAGGTLIMKDSSTITGCSASKGGGVYVDGTFKMQGGAKVDENNEVYLETNKSITVTGALTHRPAARITPNEYTDGRVLATGAAAERDNFKVTPKNGTEYWRYKKKGDVIKFVKAELKVTFVKIKCVKNKDIGGKAEYYWTMKVDGVMVDDQFDANSTCELATGQIHTIDKSFTRTFKYFPAGIEIPVNIEIYEEDNGPDDHIGTTKAKLTYHYNHDAWQWGYVANGHENGNQGLNGYKLITEGDEVEFTEEYRHNDGDTDVTIKIRWQDE